MLAVCFEVEVRGRTDCGAAVEPHPHLTGIACRRASTPCVAVASHPVTRFGLGICIRVSHYVLNKQSSTFLFACRLYALPVLHIAGSRNGHAHLVDSGHVPRNAIWVVRVQEVQLVSNLAFGFLAHRGHRSLGEEEFAR
jgi:hypothetical protein